MGEACVWAAARAAAVGGASVETLTIAAANDADEIVAHAAFAVVEVAPRRWVRSSADARVGRVAEDKIIA